MNMRQKNLDFVAFRSAKVAFVAFRSAKVAGIKGHVSPRSYVLACLTLLTCLMLPTVLLADDANPVESAGRSLRRAQRFPWYDAQRDELRRVDVAPRRDSAAANRDSTWEEDDASTTSNWQFNFSGLPDLFWSIMQGLAWTLLAALLIGLTALLVWAFMRSEGRWGGGDGTELSVHRASDVDRVESLPFQLKRPQSDLLAEARRHYEAGNYGEAIIYLFSYQLVQLDKQQLIHLTKGKTNRQYLREIRRRPVLSGLLENTMVAFEDVFFGHHALERERFETCWRGLDQFHQQIEQATS
ncbi:MAG: hypothetical protein J5I93_00215 [Pirellulaceae bacterium]|nr:hypothetical protein [Pirellulaceae bacterium]